MYTSYDISLAKWKSSLSIIIILDLSLAYYLYSDTVSAGGTFLTTVMHCI